MTTQSELLKFATYPSYDDRVKDLAENLADKEEWDFSDSPKKRYAILKNYLEFTFRRLRQENKVVYSTEKKFAAFNTGLVTSNLEDIIAFFEEYKKPGFPFPFCFEGFLKRSDNKILRNFSDPLPVANYFEKPELLLFNPKCELVPEIDHIVTDNRGRFPKHLQNADAAEVRRQLFGAIEDIKKRVRTNYMLAVPQYYANGIQLLLPLCLTIGSANPDLALVIYKLNDKTYTARTCLTLQMAYNNARLIVKPQSNWLKP